MRQKTILLTGATGFVGSSLAARFLESGHRILALSRNDERGERTQRAIKAAATGLGITSPSYGDRLKVIEFDIHESSLEISPDALKSVDEAWHVAAEMSYNSSKIYESFGFNVAGLGSLYSTCAASAANCQRFYHVSTAYVAAFEDACVAEEIHCYPRVQNTYQLTKWTGEVLLRHLVPQSRLPVTVFRPSIVAGSSETGWSSGVGFGVYMFFEAQLRARDAGQKAVRFPLQPEAAANIIPVDVLVDRAERLSQVDDRRRPFEIVACVADSNVRLREIAKASSSVYGTTVDFGPPDSRFDRRMSRSVSLNAGFANRTWEFDATNMKRLLGEAYLPFHMRPKHMLTIAEGYLANRKSRIGRAAASAAPVGCRHEEQNHAA